MKKIIVILFIISSLYILNNKDEIIIPANSIRFRIIANSNSIEDQTLKNTIKDDLITNVLPNITNTNDIDTTINNSIPLIKETLNKYNTNYEISYGNNYFPKKIYKGINYPSGKYKSLVITLNEGLGNNFWCVMYPPLCLIENNNSNNIEYKSIVKEIVNKYNNNLTR